MLLEKAERHMSTNNLTGFAQRFVQGDLFNLTPFLLLLIGVSGNFVAETLSCRTQKLFSKSMMAKQLIIFAVVYFTLTATSDENSNPLLKFAEAIGYYALFLAFTKMTPFFTAVGLFLLIALYILQQFITYFGATGASQQKIDDWVVGATVVQYTLLGLIVIGFVFYFLKQYRDHSDDFSVKTFLFGTLDCDSHKESTDKVKLSTASSNTSTFASKASDASEKAKKTISDKTTTALASLTETIKTLRNQIKSSPEVV